jgi:hypothetical protein
MSSFVEVTVRHIITTVSMLAAMAPRLDAQGVDDRFALVSRLGVDTIAIEMVERAPGTVTAQVLIRSPETRLFNHTLVLDAEGKPARLVATELDPNTGAARESQEWVWVSDSVRLPNGRSAPAPAGSLPFIDLVHWPFDHLLRDLRASGNDSTGAPMISGARVSQFPLRLFGDDSATVTHPTRGTMRLTVGEDGRIITLDAGATTRALIVTRESRADVEALAREFARRDAATGGMGELSGRGETTTMVHGATIDLDWGAPRMRGREIWGGLVRFGELWRTGANRATHFTTDRPLRFGTLDVPAGSYTLYSIPAADGGILIINGQTGQNGQQYDQSRDIGRVALTRRPLATPVEVFTIEVRPSGEAGELALKWADSEFVVDFEVK